jgi:hypothetical protein
MDNFVVTFAGVLQVAIELSVSYGKASGVLYVHILRPFFCLLTLESWSVMYAY